MRKYYIFKELYNGSFLAPVAQAMPIKNYKINNLTIKFALQGYSWVFIEGIMSLYT